MSTRCQVKVIQEGLPWEQAVTLYHHCDGYPTNMLPLFVKAMDLARKTECFSEYALGRAGKVAGFLCHADPGQFEPEEGHALHLDIEFYYKLFAVNDKSGSMAERPKWKVAVFTYRLGELTEITGRLEIHKAAKQADKIEAAA